jgi:hypothetical protein
MMWWIITIIAGFLSAPLLVYLACAITNGTKEVIQTESDGSATPIDLGPRSRPSTLAKRAVV